MSEAFYPIGYEMGAQTPPVFSAQEGQNPVRVGAGGAQRSEPGRSDGERTGAHPAPTRTEPTGGGGVPWQDGEGGEIGEASVEGVEAGWMPKGRQPNPVNESAVLRTENERLQREVSRQQALVRAAQRSVGLAPPIPMPTTKSGKKTRKRRVARALTVAARLHKDNAQATPSPSAAMTPEAV